jgi:ArsR family transcriptional regulator, lead/cadmium/zinc/bismuth-responsive transcriptional repressor
MPRPSKAVQLSEPSPSDCDERIVHVDAVRAAREALPSGPAMRELTSLFAALGDPTRLRILAALATQELCVCDLAATIGQSESAVSHQLRHLRSLRLVRSRREGRRVFYALDDDHVLGIYDQACDHVHHNLTLAGPVASDATS